MSNYQATVLWQRNDDKFVGNEYSRAHTWKFSGGTEVPASASHHIVPLPWSKPEYVDPEEAFVASLASCHMLFFLSIACQQGYQVDSYTDEAVGTLARDERGKMSMTEVRLYPTVVFGGKKVPGQDAIAAIHHQAHEQCFIANSVRTSVLVVPQ